MADVKLEAVLTLKDKMTGGLQKSEGSFDKWAKRGVEAAGLVVVAIGVKAVQAAVEFETAMSNVSTLISGDSTDAINQFSEGIKDLMKAIPVDAEELGASAYAIVSAGFTDAAEAIKILETSAKLGVAGLGTTEEATTLLTVAMNAFASQGLTSDETADILFKTVKGGITTVGDLSTSFGKMAGTASAANITIEEASAATAALSGLTGKTSESQMALNQIFIELTQKGGKLDKALQEQGSSVDELNASIGENGLVDGMKKTMEATGLTETEFKTLFSSAEGGTAVYQLLTDAYDANKTALTDMTEGANAVDEAFQKQTETTQAQYDLMKNNLNVVMMELGEKILPILIEIMPLVIGVIEDMMGGFEELMIIVDDVMDWFDRLWAKVKEIWGNITGFFSDMGDKAADINILGWTPFDGKAGGGYVSGGTPYMVGERGPEMFVPSQSGNIVPNNKLGGGGITLNITGNSFGNKSDIDYMINEVKRVLNREQVIANLRI